LKSGRRPQEDQDAAGDRECGSGGGRALTDGSVSRVIRSGPGYASPGDDEDVLPLPARLFLSPPPPAARCGRVARRARRDPPARRAGPGVIGTSACRRGCVARVPDVLGGRDDGHVVRPPRHRTSLHPPLRSDRQHPSACRGARFATAAGRSQPTESTRVDGSSLSLIWRDLARWRGRSQASMRKAQSRRRHRLCIGSSRILHGRCRPPFRRAVRFRRLAGRGPA
jgi:hypothetical protein